MCFRAPASSNLSNSFAVCMAAVASAISLFHTARRAAASVARGGSGCTWVATGQYRRATLRSNSKQNIHERYESKTARYFRSLYALDCGRCSSAWIAALPRRDSRHLFMKALLLDVHVHNLTGVATRGRKSGHWETFQGWSRGLVQRLHRALKTASHATAAMRLRGNDLPSTAMERGPYASGP